MQVDYDMTGQESYRPLPEAVHPRVSQHLNFVNTSQLSQSNYWQDIFPTVLQLMNSKHQGVNRKKPEPKKKPEPRKKVNAGIKNPRPKPKPKVEKKKKSHFEILALIPSNQPTTTTTTAAVESPPVNKPLSSPHYNQSSSRLDDDGKSALIIVIP